ncbi:TetR/AcrR family transcriptional regulator [Qipengyuania sp. 6D47A]|uniref:TetR/AcrR family transcriptional regulator n=1 Tax=Qipengyuania qiaonensis TaxID=2867240 RepID=A0ABS7J9F2_9SPHN|nr:TetR/AcrR family transcriptional regulator [Qipengyuania qiaonensis]
MASRELRKRGPAHVSVGDIMSGAGLTHGGFYAHFGSKDALVGEAIAAMFEDVRLRTSELDAALNRADDGVRAALFNYWRSYLSADHRDRPERGCPLPALSGEVGRMGGAAADALSQGLGEMTARMMRALERLEYSNPDARATAVVAQLVGAIALARALGRTAESDALLNNCYEDLVGRYGS